MEVKDGALPHLLKQTTKKKSFALDFYSIPFSQTETCIGHTRPAFDRAGEDNGIEDGKPIRWKELRLLMTVRIRRALPPWLADLGLFCER